LTWSFWGCFPPLLLCSLLQIRRTATCCCPQSVLGICSWLQQCISAGVLDPEQVASSCTTASWGSCGFVD
jgi:hypothetical protein